MSKIRQITEGTCEQERQQWFNSLVEHNDVSQRIYSYCLRMLFGCKEDAEDARQITLFNAYRGLHLYDPDLASFATWVLSIARNVCLNYYRSPRLRRFSAEDDPEIIENTADPKSGSDIESLINQSVLAENLALVPADQRTVLMLYAVEGLSYEEIAENLEIPVGTVKSRIFTAREKLAKELTNSGFLL